MVVPRNSRCRYPHDDRSRDRMPRSVSGYVSHALAFHRWPRCLSALLAVSQWRPRRCPRRLRRALQAQHQFDQLVAAQALEIGTIHSPFKSTILLNRKGVGDYSLRADPRPWWACMSQARSLSLSSISKTSEATSYEDCRPQSCGGTQPTFYPPSRTMCR